MSIVVVTGATGLVGANLCKILHAGGHQVRAFVRADPDGFVGTALGVDVVVGDVTDVASVRQAAVGADAIVHAAALLGGASEDIDDYMAVNLEGTVNVLEAGSALRTVVLSTSTFFDYEAGPLTEDSPLAATTPDTPYSSSKRAAFEEVQRRAAAGQDVVVVVPGGIYGPSPWPDRALAPTSFNAAIVAAVQGSLSRYIRIPIAWVLAEDVARCTARALERGEAGRRYLAFGRQRDAMSFAEFFSRACALAGVAHRVADVDARDVRTDDAFSRTLVQIAALPFPTPLFEYQRTLDALGYQPVAVDDGLLVTLAWLRQLGRLAPPAAVGAP